MISFITAKIKFFPESAKRIREKTFIIQWIFTQTAVKGTCLSSHLNHLHMAEPIVQVFLLEHVTQLIAQDFRAAYLGVDVRM